MLSYVDLTRAAGTKKVISELITAARLSTPHQKERMRRKNDFSARVLSNGASLVLDVLSVIRTIHLFTQPKNRALLRFGIQGGRGLQQSRAWAKRSPCFCTFGPNSLIDRRHREREQEALQCKPYSDPSDRSCSDMEPALATRLTGALPHKSIHLRCI